MALKKKRKTNYDDDYDLGRSYDEYDYSQDSGENTYALEADEDDGSTDIGRMLLWNAINNTALFVLAYMIMYLVYQSGTLWMAHRWGLNAVLRYFITNTTPIFGIWDNVKMIKWIYSTGPVFTLSLSLFSLALYFRYFQKAVGLFRNFLLWLHLIGYMMFFGGAGAGILIRNDYCGFGYAINWSYFTNFTRYVFLGGCIVMMLMVGFWTVRAFLQTATSSDLVRRRGGARMEFLFFTVLAPIVAGSFVVCLPRLPLLEYYEIISLLFFTPTVLAMLSYGRQITTLRLVRSLDEISISKSAIVLAVLLLVSIRVVLDPGIAYNSFDPKLEKPLWQSIQKQSKN